MEPPPKRQSQHDHDTDGSLWQEEVAQPQSGGHRESNTHDGIGIQSKGNFTVGGDLHINVNNTTKETEDTIKQKQKEKEEARKRHLNALQFSQMDTREFGIRKAHASTCQWILMNHQYQRWAQTRKEQGSDRLIWLKGKPGTGKSTMMKFLLEHIRSQLVVHGDNEVLISFFFNARGNDLEKTTLGMYRSLLLQLFQKRAQAQTVLDNLQPDHEWTIDSLESVLEKTLLYLDGTTVTCLVDALDECGPSQARDMVGLFNRLTQITDSLYVCFASRHYPHISIATSLEIVLEHQPEHRHDIERYLSSTLKIGSGQLVDEICSDILAKSSGIFMWVVLVVDILNREFDAGRKHILRKRLGQLPRDLHELFRDILTRDTENVDGLLLCLQWLLFARRPLTLKELYFAIISGLEPDSLQICHVEDISEDDIRKYILSNSKGLAEPVGSYKATVQFIHESIVDFLIKDNGLATIFSDLGERIDGRSHDSLKFCCLKYIEFVRPQVSRWTNLRFPFMYYALEEVIFHADQAEAGGINQKDFMASLGVGNWICSLEEDSKLPSPLYLLAVKGAVSLVRAHPTNLSCFTIGKSNYPMPIIAATAAGMTEMVLALLEMEVRRVPALSFQDLRGQFLKLKIEEIQVASKTRNTYRRDMEPLVLLAQCAPELASIVFLRTVESNLNVTDSYGRTAVFYAISRQHYNLLEHISGMGADLSLRDIGGRGLGEGALATHWAAFYGGVKSLAILDRYGCQIDAHDEHGRTPLHHAAVVSAEAVKFLVRRGANIEAKDKDGQTPLHHAARRVYADETISELVDGGAFVNARDPKGRTPLHHAITLHDLRGAKSLLSNRADVSAADNEGQTPLKYALWRHYADPALLGLAIKLLQEHGADVSAVHHRGETPLHWSLQYGQHHCVVQLVKCGADVSKPDRNRYTPIWWAIYSRWQNIESIQLLIEHGANIQDPDQDGYTLLHRAVERAKLGVVKVLVRNGASPNAKNKHGQSSFDLALSLGFAEIGHFLSPYIDESFGILVE